MTTTMNLTEACRVSHDYIEHCWGSQEHAARAQAWVKEVLSLRTKLERKGSKPPYLYFLIMDYNQKAFSPDDASFDTWAMYARRHAEAQWKQDAKVNETRKEIASIKEEMAKQ